MVKSISAQVALLVFALTIVAGLRAGNAPTTVLTRALVCMFVASIAAQVAVWLTRAVLRDYLLSRKTGIEKSHLAQRQVTAAANATPRSDDTVVDRAGEAETQ